MDRQSLILSLTGVGNEESFEMRKQYLKSGESFRTATVISSLLGVDTVESMELRRTLAESLYNETTIGSIAETLVGIDTPESIKFRKWLRKKKNADTRKLLIGLTDTQSKEAQKLKRSLQKETLLRPHSDKIFDVGGDVTGLSNVFRASAWLWGE